MIIVAAHWFACAIRLASDMSRSECREACLATFELGKRDINDVNSGVGKNPSPGDPDYREYPIDYDDLTSSDRSDLKEYVGHAFCTDRVAELPKKGVAEACPLCRAALPPGREKLF